MPQVCPLYHDRTVKEKLYLWDWLCWRWRDLYRIPAESKMCSETPRHAIVRYLQYTVCSSTIFQEVTTRRLRNFLLGLVVCVFIIILLKLKPVLFVIKPFDCEFVYSWLAFLPSEDVAPSLSLYPTQVLLKIQTYAFLISIISFHHCTWYREPIMLLMSHAFVYR